MRRYLFSLVTVLVMAAAIPALALAQSGDQGRDHHDRVRDRFELRHHRRHHRLEHFRAPAAAPGMAPAAAGTVKSFNAGVLIITLSNGNAASGLVNNNTNVQCQAMSGSFTTEDGGPGPSGGSGGDRGDNATGDGGDANDQGEDQGDRNDVNEGSEANGNDANEGSEANDNDVNDDNPGQSCAMELRTPGTHVRDATLTLTGSGAVWNRVDLDV